jgi:2-haloalkanoic acid dehalogenase type II
MSAATATLAAKQMQETPGKRLCDFEVLSFDCYGTLIDWESGIWDALQRLIMHNGGQGPGRRGALELFAFHENRVQQDQPGLAYPAVLEQVHASISAHSGLRTTLAMDRDFGASVGHWPAFQDTAEALRELQRRYQLVILSNVDGKSFAASNRKLGVTFDAVYTAEDIGSYKPSPANFRYLVERVAVDLGVASDRILHTAQSLYHDHAPARICCLANCWIDRQRLSEGGAWGATATMDHRPETDFHFFTLAELAAAVEAEGDS